MMANIHSIIIIIIIIIVYFSVPVDQRVKIKESEKRNNHLKIARELRSLWNMKVTALILICY